MTKPHSLHKASPSALKNLAELATTLDGKQIARDFGDQCANMKVYDAIRLSRLLEAAFQAGKKLGIKESKQTLIDALKRLS